MSFNTESKKTLNEYTSSSHRSSSVRFKDTEFERSDSSRSHPIWRPAYDSDTDSAAPQYRSIKPILTPTTGRSSAISTGLSPISANEFERPQKFMLSTEQLSSVTRDSQVVRPKAVAACTASNQSKQYPIQSSHSPQFYTAVAGPPYHNQKHLTETHSSHLKMHESMECSQRSMTSSSTRVMFEDQQQHQHQHQHQHLQRNTIDMPMEPQMSATFTASPTPSMTRQKLRPPPTPTKFIPGEFRESDYDSEIESLKIRPVWTPNQFPESENAHYRHRHVSPPAPNRGASVPKHHFERILTPMEFDTNTVEMPTPIKCLPSSSPSYGNQATHQFKTQTLDRYRTKKKCTGSQYGGASSQDDINIMHSTPKYCRRSPAMHQSYGNESPSGPTYREESRSSQCGKLKTQAIFDNSYFIHLLGINCMVFTYPHFEIQSNPIKSKM